MTRVLTWSRQMWALCRLQYIFIFLCPEEMIQSFRACFCQIALITDRPFVLRSEQFHWASIRSCHFSWHLEFIAQKKWEMWGQDFPWGLKAVAEEPACPCLHCRCLEILFAGAARASHDLQPVWGVDTSCKVSMLEIAVKKVMLHISLQLDSS